MLGIRRYCLRRLTAQAAATLRLEGNHLGRQWEEIAGHHDEWGAFDREEIGFLLHSGKNEVDIDVVSHHTDNPPAQSPTALEAAIHITHADGAEERLVGDEKWQARSTTEDS